MRRLWMVGIAFCGQLVATVPQSSLLAQGTVSEPRCYVNRGDDRADEVCFPHGAVSFADVVVSADFGTPRTSRAGASHPETALGEPDYDPSIEDDADPQQYVTLGCGGTLTLRFGDNRLTDVPGPDLYVFEIGGQFEPTRVSISARGTNWIDVGSIEGGLGSLDIGDSVEDGEAYQFVRLTDERSYCSGDWPGADIDAVGAIGPREPEAVLVLDVLSPDPLGPDLPFRARLTYEEPPTRAPTAALATWDGGSFELPLSRSGTGRVFVSDWYYPGPRSSREPHEMPGLIGDAKRSAQIAAELFAGPWSVTHSGAETDDALGVALVSDDGRDARLFLQAGEQVRRYESFEMLATRDSTAGRHTLDIRFQANREGAPWGPSVRRNSPEGQVLFVPDGAESLTVTAEGESVIAAVALPEAPPERFRVALMARPPAAQLSGAWHEELPTGDLGDGGQQTWGRMPTIEEVVVVEDQRLLLPPGGNYAQFLADPAPDPADYILERPPANRDRTTDYPFKERSARDKEGAQNDIAYRTLLVYGQNLPQRGADALVLRSGDEQISYALVAFPGEGKDELFEAAWQKASNQERDELTALILRAGFTAAVGPGVKTLSINGAPGAWHLDFTDANAEIGFVRHVGGPDEQGEGEDEFEPAATPFAGEVVYLALDEQTPLPLDDLAVELRLDDVPLRVNEQGRLEPIAGAPSSESHASVPAGAERRPQVETLVVKRFGSPDNAEYRSPPIRLTRASKASAGSPQPNGALLLEVEPGDVLAAQLVNPFQLRSVPRVATAEIAGDPSELGPTWKQALARTAACYGEDGIDFDTIKIEQAEAYSKSILTEKLTDDLLALMAGRLPEVSPLLALSPIAYSLRERSVLVSRGDQAAAILIRDEFLKMMQGALRDLRTIATDDQKMWAFYQSRKLSSLPFWDIARVKESEAGWDADVDAVFDERLAHDPSGAAAPLDVREAIKDVFKGMARSSDDDWVIGDFVESVTSSARLADMGAQAAHLYAFEKSREALFSHLERAGIAEARARDAGDCKLDELLLLAGQDADSVVARILPRLVRRVRGGTGEVWEPDRFARSFVKNLKNKGAEARALNEYGRLDDAYKEMAAAVVTAGTAYGLAAAGAATLSAVTELIGDVLDAAVFGGTTYDQYLASEPLVQYGEGASAVLGPGFYDEAEAMRVQGWEAALQLLAPGLGAAAGARSVAGAGSIASAGSAARGARLLHELPALDEATLAGRSARDQADLVAYFADLRSRRAIGRWQEPSTGHLLTASERDDFQRFADFYRRNGMDVTGPRLRGVGPAADEIAGAGPGGGPAGARIVGSPVGGKTGVEAQQYCSNCGLVATEAVLKDAGIVAAERPQALVHAHAWEHRLIGPDGANVYQLRQQLVLSGVPEELIRIGPYTPEDLAVAWQRGQESIAMIQNGHGGYHWVRVEGFTRDANGKAWISYGEGGLAKGQSHRKTVEEFNRLTHFYPDKDGKVRRLPSLLVATNQMSDAARDAARAAAAANARAGRAILRREARLLGLTEDEMEAVILHGPGARPGQVPTGQPRAAGDVPTGGAIPDETPTVIDGQTPPPQRPAPLPARRACDERQVGNLPATEAQLRAQARENAAAASAAVLDAMEENRALSRMEMLRIREAITADNLQRALDEIIAEARRAGVSEEEIACAIGDPGPYPASPVAWREVALASLEKLRLAREGFEIVTGEAARTFHRHSTRILARNAGKAEVEYLREQIEIASRNGRGYFDTLARQGIYTRESNFELLIRPEAIGGLERFAHEAGLPVR